MKTALVMLAWFALACTPTVGSPCKSDCDCAGGITNVKCPGNFFCRNGACAYDCASTCGASAADAGCPTGQTCVGEFCKRICEG